MYQTNGQIAKKCNMLGLVTNDIHFFSAPKIVCICVLIRNLLPDLIFQMHQLTHLIGQLIRIKYLWIFYLLLFIMLHYRSCWRNCPSCSPPKSTIGLHTPRYYGHGLCRVGWNYHTAVYQAAKSLENRPRIVWDDLWSSIIYIITVILNVREKSIRVR